MIAFSLSKPDLALARWIGRERNAAKAGIPSHKYATTRASDEEIHVLGARAEIAVARVLGVEPDRNFYRHGDGGVDLRVGGHTVDVKMRSTPYTDLLVQPDLSDFRADCIILCWPWGGNEYTVAVIGLVTRKRFIEKATALPLASPRLMIRWSDLTPIGEPLRHPSAQVARGALYG